jgi:hypothetical protein
MIKLVVFLTILAINPLSYASETKPVKDEASMRDEVAYLLDFSDYSDGPVEDWLESKGFKLEEDARDRTKLDLDVDGSSLNVEAKRPVQAFLVDEAANVKDFSKVRIEWGILKYPKGASYAKKINNEALMIYHLLWF